MSELVQYDASGPASDLVQWGQAAKAAHALAQSLSQTTFAPDQFRGKPVEATAAILAGAEVGLSPIQALNSIYVVGGRPSLYARAMVALVQRAGHEVWTDAESPVSVTVCGRRAGSERTETVTVTLAQATKAGWTRNRKYESEPQSMLWARAASTVCRRIAADALMGIPYVAEELEDDAVAGVPPATVTVSRAKRKREADLPELPPPAEPEPQPEPEAVEVEAEPVLPDPTDGRDPWLLGGDTP